MLDYGYRSKCCKAAIRMGKKKIRKTGQEIRVWICCACGTKDCDIISREEALRPVDEKMFWEDDGGAVINESEL
jgi:hypothetical protein